MKEALFYKELEAGKVQCLLCPHCCQIPDKKLGICKARVNIDGKLYSKTYAEVSSLALDPIEKKPLYHFYPGSEILSLGSFGCNFFCLFCQNWQISQHEVPTEKYTPDEIVKIAREKGAVGIAYTYNEPIVNYEFVLETSRAAQAVGLKNVLVSNGYINPEPLAGLLPYLDAVNLDIKAGDNDFYSGLCGGNIKPVLGSAKAVWKAGVHLEITTLLIPDENDDEGELESLAEWIADNCSRNTVSHLSAYSPRYKLGAEETSAEDLLQAREIFKKHLEYVYCGNMILGSECSNTYCPSCGNELIVRSGYSTEVVGVDTELNVCAQCGMATDLVL